jgi:hypothetical protein
MFLNDLFQNGNLLGERKTSAFGRVLNNISKTLTLTLVFVGFDLLGDIMNGLSQFENGRQNLC